MYEKIKKFYPDGPTNRTDPIVRHDTKYSGELITTMYNPQYDTANGGIPGTAVDATSRDAIDYPLIRINNHVLQDNIIVSFNKFF